jgi:hypothetical protein
MTLQDMSALFAQTGTIGIHALITFNGTFVCTMSIRTKTTRHFARCYLNVPKGHTEVGADEAGPIN